METLELNGDATNEKHNIKGEQLIQEVVNSRLKKTKDLVNADQRKL